MREDMLPLQLLDQVPGLHAPARSQIEGGLRVETARNVRKLPKSGQQTLLRALTQGQLPAAAQGKDRQLLHAAGRFFCPHRTAGP